MSIAIVSLLILVPVAIIGAILFVVLSKAAGDRNPNRPGGSGAESRDDTHRTSGPSRD